MSNKITTYSPKCVKLGARFATLCFNEGGVGSLAVSSIDQIYVGYCRAMKIQAFNRGGGTAIREIQCNGFEPKQITCLNDSLIINHSTSTRILGRDDDVKHIVNKSNAHPYSTVTQGQLHTYRMGQTWSRVAHYQKVHQQIEACEDSFVGLQD